MKGAAWSDLLPNNGVLARNDCGVRGNTVDGQNPAPPRMMIIPLFIGF